jgi:hypothetical protein
VKRLQNPKPVSKLIEADRNAPAVFLAILELAQGGDHVKCTRGDIRSVTGLSEKRITKAITALHNARWVHRAYGRRGISAQWYQISVGKWVSPLRVGKRPSRKRAKGTKTTLKAQTLEGPKTTLLSLKREGDAQAPSPIAIASAPALRSPVTQEHPADRVEREHFERLRERELEATTCP